MTAQSSKTSDDTRDPLLRRVLLARVARKYYFDNLSKVEIAAEFGVSRFQVARLLEQAVASGVVRIDIEDPRTPRSQQELDLAERLHVRYVRIVRDPGDGLSTTERIGAAVVTLLREEVAPGMTVGLSSSRALDAGARYMRELPSSTVVQLSGAYQVGTGTGVTRLLLEMNQRPGVAAYPLFAPLVVDQVATAEDIRRQPVVADTLRRANSLDIAVVSVGAWREGESSVWAQVDPAIRSACSDAGVVAEFSGILINSDGRPVATPLDGRTIGVTHQQLMDAKHVLGVLYGSARLDAARSAAESGIFTGFIIDDDLASALLR